MKFIAVLLLAFCAPVFAQTCTTTITTATSVATTISNATGGDVICLRPGDYGYESISAVKSSRVTICSTTTNGSTCSGRGAKMSMEVYRSNRLTFKSIEFNSSVVLSDYGDIPASKNLTIINSLFSSGQLLINLAGNSNANFLFDGNTFDTNYVSDGIEGTVYTFRNPNNNSGPTGVTFSNNIWEGTGSCSDGFNNTTSGGLTVGPGNIFRNWSQNDSSCPPSNPPHVDTIQEYADVTYKGNYFTGNTVNIGIYDGAGAVVIEHNIFNGQQNPAYESFQMGSTNGLIFRHNTFKNTIAGIVSKQGNPPNSNWLIENNIFINSDWSTANSFQDEGCGSGCVIRYNIINNTSMSLVATPTNTVTGAPTFSGGATPSTWQGWRLSVGSNGKAAGNDGKDMGTNYFNPAAPGSFQ